MLRDDTLTCQSVRHLKTRRTCLRKALLDLPVVVAAVTHLPTTSELEIPCCTVVEVIRQANARGDAAEHGLMGRSCSAALRGYGSTRSMNAAAPPVALESSTDTGSHTPLGQSSSSCSVTPPQTSGCLRRCGTGAPSAEPGHHSGWRSSVLQPQYILQHGASSDSDRFNAIEEELNREELQIRENMTFRQRVWFTLEEPSFSTLVRPPSRVCMSPCACAAVQRVPDAEAVSWHKEDRVACTASRGCPPLPASALTLAAHPLYASLAPVLSRHALCLC